MTEQRTLNHYVLGQIQAPVDVLLKTILILNVD